MTLKTFCASIAAAAALLIATAASADTPEGGVPMERATMLSAFGERAAFSPDGKRVAFVGKSYGDAYEIDLASGHVRNLTGQFPHQGVLRVQYLQNGDYLIVGPRRYIGPTSRANVDLFILDKHLRTGLQPLDQGVFEGVAMGPRNIIAWQQIPAGAKLREGESWIEGVMRLGPEYYVGRIDYQNGKPRLLDKRRIMTPAPAGCGLMELQDFRKDGNEVVFYAFCGQQGGNPDMHIYGYDLHTGQYTNFLTTKNYAEVEGIAPGGAWSTVECGTRKGPEFMPPLDICRLELVPNGKLSRVIIGTAPGSSKKVSNPVVSPDGKSIAFQSADSAIGDVGEGGGIYLMPLPN
jgi:hypothetical protein